MSEIVAALQALIIVQMLNYMLVVRCLLTIILTQRSSCIGRLQAQKDESLFVQA